MKISKVIYYSTLVIGGGLIMFDQLGFGVGVMIVGGFLAIMTDSEAGVGSTYEPRRKEPYYKNEFEEYQHYKHCKRNLKK